MPIEFVTGDLLTTPGLTAIAHGCNCAGAMGKGIAKEIRNRWPRMYDEYRRRCQERRFTLGDVFVWEEGGMVIFNLGTQRSWKTQAELLAIDKSLKAMLELAEQRGLATIGLPKLGAGLGGLDWREVKKLLQEVGDSTSVRLVVFEEYEPNKVASFAHRMRTGSVKGLLLGGVTLCSLLAFAGDPSAKLEPLDREITRPPPFPRKWETNLTGLTVLAKNGDAAAQFDLGAHYIFAVGTTQDLVKAYHWLTNSASRSFPPAQYTLGKLYKHGIGVVSNQARADAWFQKAAEMGYTPAKHEAALTADREGNRAEALKLLREAAEGGFPSSEYLLGCVVSGPVESYVWHSLAAEGGLESAGTKALELRQVLTKEQLAEAEERVRQFRAKRLAPPP